MGSSTKYTRAFRQKRRAAGLCTMCGEPAAPFALCSVHREYDKNEHHKRLATITVQCVDCGKKKCLKHIKHRDYSKWRCKSCTSTAQFKDPIYRTNYLTAIADRKKAHLLSKGFYEPKIEPKIEKVKIQKIKLSPLEHSQACAQRAKLKWQDPEYRKKSIDSRKKLFQSLEYRQKISSVEHRQACSQRSKLKWQDPEYRRKVLAAKSTAEFKKKMAIIQASEEYKTNHSVGVAKQPRVSSLQTILYSMLDDLNVKYYREYVDKPCDVECVIGPWVVDCVVPRQGKTSLIIECNGDWVHSQPQKQKADKAKTTYITSYCPQYELKNLWEHEFSNYNRIKSTLEYWLGLTKPTIKQYNFNQIIIKSCPAEDYRLLLAKYHYLSNAGRGGIAFGAYLDDILIAVCIFSPLSRQNILTDVDYKNVRELSRLCIHPNYQVKNLASWFISRCIKQLPSNIKTIMTYADATFNHNGGVYLASGFKFDKIVLPDYWYMNEVGWVMHKKTLYNKAVNLSCTESEYAKRFGYFKVHGHQKRRFVFARSA